MCYIFQNEKNCFFVVFMDSNLNLEHFEIKRGLKKDENVTNDHIIFDSFLLVTPLSS